jgi:diadenosine tetraphosphate (Ap4A) HIT family hydrolase
MNYISFLRKFMKKGACPFCDPERDFVITENNYAYITPARAPYMKDHLLVIPKRHITDLGKLRKNEKNCLFDLIVSGMNVLRKKYPAVEVDYKEGDMKISKKSVPHLHFHLIPKRKWSNPNETSLRKFLSEEDLVSEAKKISRLW